MKNHRTQARMHRRAFLKTIGCAGAAALAPLTLVRAARADSAARKVIFFYIPDGCIPDRFHPTGSEFDFSLAPMTEPLDSVRQYCTFLDGLTMYAGGPTHEGGIRKVLTANAAQSLDDFLADRIGAQSPFRSLYLGVGANYENGSGGFSFLRSGIPQSPEDNPLAAFTRLFGSEDDLPASLDEDPRLKILDHSIGEVQAMRSRLGAVERQRLEQHLEALRLVEQRIEQTSANLEGCGPTNWNPQGFTVPSGWHGYPPRYDREEFFETVGALQMDLIVESLACDLTRVASLQWSHPVSPTLLSWTGASQRHHDASHFGNPDSATAQDFILSQRFFTGQFAQLIQKLQARPDPSGDGSLLDHTRILLFSELGDSNLHDHNRVPFILAGAGRDFSGGRLLQYDREAHAKLLVSIAQSMDPSVTSYGYSGHGIGGLPEL